MYMIVMKIFEGKYGTFRNTDDAINYMNETNFKNEISLYDINPHKAYEKTNKIYNVIKEYNKGKPIDDQILPSNPYAFREILGCLGVQVYSITLGTYEENHECIALFSGYNESVLDKTMGTVKIAPSFKALYSLGLMASLFSDN